MKVGMVELVIERKGIRAHSHFEAAEKAVRRDKQRDKTVKEALLAAKQLDCELIVFPGWTLIGDSLPQWIISESKGCTVILELAPAGEAKSNRAKRLSKSTAHKQAGAKGKGKGGTRGAGHGTYILHNGKVAAGPVMQRFGFGRAVEKAGRITDEARRLVDDLLRPGSGRHWDHPRLGRITLLVCGEISMVGGGGGNIAGGNTSCYHRQALRDAGLPASWAKQTSVFINPGHVAGMPQANRDKRKWLSKKSALLATANLPQGPWQEWSPHDRAYYRVNRSARNAAEAYARGKRERSLADEARTASYCIRTTTVRS